MPRKEDQPLLAVESGPTPAPEHLPGTFLLRGVYYKIIPKRWGILAIIAIMQLAELYSMAFFAFINDLVSAYFRTPPAMSDLLTTLYWASRAVFGPIVAMASQRFNQRTIALVSSGIMFISYVMLLVGISSRQNFFIVLIGQILGGCASALIIPLLQVLATNWFPKNEHGKVVSIQPIFRRLSLIISSVVAAQSLILVYNRRHELTVNYAHPSFNWVQIGFFIGFCILTLAAFIGTLLFVTDHPPIVKSTEPESSSEDKSIWNPIQELKGIWNLLKKKKFVILLILNILIQAPAAFNVALVSSIFIGTMSNVNDKFVGVMFCTGQVMGLLASALAAVVLDKFHKPKITFLSGVGSVIVFYITMFFALYYHNLPGAFVSYVLIIGIRDYIRVCHNQRLVAVMYNEPKEERFKAFTINGTVPYLVPPIVAFIARVVMIHYGAAFAYFIPIAIVTVAGVMLWCLWDYVSDVPK